MANAYENLSLGVNSGSRNSKELEELKEQVSKSAEDIIQEIIKLRNDLNNIIPLTSKAENDQVVTEEPKKEIVQEVAPVVQESSSLDNNNNGYISMDELLKMNNDSVEELTPVTENVVSLPVTPEVSTVSEEPVAETIPDIPEVPVVETPAVESAPVTPVAEVAPAMPEVPVAETPAVESTPVTPVATPQVSSTEVLHIQIPNAETISQKQRKILVSEEENNNMIRKYSTEEQIGGPVKSLEFPNVA